jgi:hypothetical protein
VVRAIGSVSLQPLLDDKSGTIGTTRSSVVYHAYAHVPPTAGFPGAAGPGATCQIQPSQTQLTKRHTSDVQCGPSVQGSKPSMDLPTLLDVIVHDPPSLQHTIDRMGRADATGQGTCRLLVKWRGCFAGTRYSVNRQRSAAGTCVEIDTIA